MNNMNYVIRKAVCASKPRNAMSYSQVSFISSIPKRESCLFQVVRRTHHWLSCHIDWMHLAPLFSLLQSVPQSVTWQWNSGARRGAWNLKYTRHSTWDKRDLTVLGDIDVRRKYFNRSLKTYIKRRILFYWRLVEELKSIFKYKNGKSFKYFPLKTMTSNMILGCPRSNCWFHI